VQPQISEAAGVRYLHFGSESVQGAMRIARPWALELEYTREMMACLLFRAEPNWPRTALVIGLGAGSLTKFLHRYRPDARLCTVEIEPVVVVLARQYFKLPADDQRFKVSIGDGAEFIARSKKSYDLLLVDGFDADARSGDLDTMPFYLNAKRCLRNGGLFVTNFLSRRKSFNKSVTRLDEAFDGRVLVFPPCESGNVVAFATVGPTLEMSFGRMLKNALLLKRETSLNLLPTVARLFPAQSGSESIVRL
jgi:spermidine synthase